MTQLTHARRPRARDRKAEDSTRSKRMFGNLLGTLQKFKDDDGKSRGSEAAKRREQTSARIAERLRSETTKQHAIAETERELKALRVATESAVYVLKHKEIAVGWAVVGVGMVVLMTSLRHNTTRCARPRDTSTPRPASACRSSTRSSPLRACRSRAAQDGGTRASRRCTL